VGPVKAYNSNGLWLKEPEAVAGSAGIARRGRVHRPQAAARAREGGATTSPPSSGAQGDGDDMHLMVDFNQGLDLAEALQRCHAIDDLGLAWIEEPIVYDNLDGFARLAAELKTPSRSARTSMGRATAQGAAEEGLRSRDAGFHAHRRRHRLARAAAIAGAAGIPMSTHLYPEVAAHVMRVTETAHWLEWQNWADPILQNPTRRGHCREEPGYVHLLPPLEMSS
jgi:mandelate racemase